MSGSRATWWRQGTPATSYWRCELPARHLPGKVLDLGFDDVKPNRVFPTDGLPWFPRQEGVAIWQFPGNATRGLMMGGMRERGIRVLMEMDDNYMISPPHIPGLRIDWVRTLDRSGDDKHSSQAHKRLLGLADRLIVSTPALERAYRRFHSKIYCCPNQVDPDDWQQGDGSGDGVLRIGYAGSAGHIHDASDVRGALDWASRQDGVQVMTFGIPQTWGFPHERVPWTDDLADYRRSLRALDVGLCPLRPGEWADCKSDVKALEYAMVGALPIVSRTEPYRSWWEHDTPALVCSTPKEFLKAVRWCVNNRDQVRALAEECRQVVLATRTIQQNIWRWEEAIEDEDQANHHHLRALVA